MKETTGFPARYNLIKLYRKGVHVPEPFEQTGETQIMLAMDYFDALEVQTFDSDKDGFNEFMGLSINDELTEHDVAMQSIPLYCPELSGDQVREYCCENECFRDPLGSDAGEFRYFGMIQVFVTPEMLVRFDREHFIDRAGIDVREPNWKDDLYMGIYQAFFKDIHMLMADFVKNRLTDAQRSSFIYRVCQSMSVGDFVVVIKCASPELPFEVAQTLRRRKYELERPVRSCYGDLCSSFVYYKTYTLMSLNTHIIRAGLEDGDVMEDAAYGDRRFVLRCVLSNKYWSDEKNINDTLSPREYLGGRTCLRLNGRYDFTVNLSEQAFLYIHPYLVRFKLGGKPDHKEPDTVSLPDDEEKNLCDTIVALMRQGCISYVNERFLFKGGEEIFEAGDCNQDISLMPAEDGFLFANRINAQRLDKLEESVRRSYSMVLKIDTSRRSIVYSMRLLERFVGLCHSINGISDSRIYCHIIMRQVETVLSGVDYYLSYLGVSVPGDASGEDRELMCSDEEYYELINALDCNLKMALEYLNSFARFILDSSLQSLQTPHYNLETHVSVEKLLLGYSYFVQRFFDWFSQSKMCRKIRGLRSEYLTLMVPQPMDTSLITTTLFNWRKDESLRMRLLAVLCPSFNDLTDFSASVGILLHEVAHSLRYENRRDRNRMFLTYSRELLFDQVGQSIVEDFRKNIIGIENFSFYEKHITRCLAAAYGEYIDDPYEALADTSFSTLVDMVVDRYKEFTKAVGYLTRLKRFLQDVLNDYDIRSYKRYEHTLEAVRRLFSSIFTTIENEGEDPSYVKDFYEVLYCLEELELCDDVPEGSKSYEPLRLLHDHLNAILFVEEEGGAIEFLGLCANVARFEREVNRSIRREIMDQRDRVESRKIARYLHLGSYAALDGKEQDFADYAESFIVTTQAAALEFFRSMVDIYQEVTSDLYMVKLLGLTSYGYLNFYTRNVPVEDLMSETYARRFCMVLYALEREKRGGADIDWNAVWVGLYKSVAGHFLTFAETYGREECSGILNVSIATDSSDEMISGITYLNALEAKIRKSLTESDPVEIDSNMRLVAEGLLAIKESLVLSNGRDFIYKQEKFVADLLHCRYLCSNFLSLGYDCLEHFQILYRYDYLAEDLLRGCGNLNLLHDEFKASGLWKYCGHISDVYNEDGAGIMGQAARNRLMAEFVLDMNYSMLYRNAFEMTE